MLLAACSPAPSDRIAKNMPAYEQLPKEHQAKVARGELEKGNVSHGGSAGMGGTRTENGGQDEREIRNGGFTRGAARAGPWAWAEEDSGAGIPA